MNNEVKLYIRICPKCNGEIYHATEKSMASSVKLGRLCRGCSQTGKKLSDESKRKMSLAKIGKLLSKEHSYKISQSNSGVNHPMYGKHHSEEMRKNQSDRYRGRHLSETVKKKLKISNRLAWKRPETRQKYNDSLSKTKWLKVRSDIGQLELLGKWNKLGFKFEPNYQLKTDNFLYYLDGYDKEKNVVLEYDGKYHNSSNQKQKDLIRQQNILDTLNPRRFWRYNKKDNSFRCIS
jgi:very-short-patch-repair endonuclease